MVGWHLYLAGVAMLFLAFLVWRMRPGFAPRGVLGAEVKAARARVRAAKTPRARAETLCEAGARRWRGALDAAGFFLRAMHADPAWPDAVERLVAAFRRRRPRMLEKILWRRLGSMPWDASHRASLLVVTATLRQLYEKERRDSARAAVFRRLEPTFQPPP